MLSTVILVFSNLSVRLERRCSIVLVFDFCGILGYDLVHSCWDFCLICVIVDFLYFRLLMLCFDLFYLVRNFPCYVLVFSWILFSKVSIWLVSICFICSKMLFILFLFFVDSCYYLIFWLVESSWILFYKVSIWLVSIYFILSKMLFILFWFSPIVDSCFYLICLLNWVSIRFRHYSWLSLHSSSSICLVSVLTIYMSCSYLCFVSIFFI